MAQSKAKTVDGYLAELPDDRRAVVETVLTLVRKNLPEGYRETLNYGGVCWAIPLEDYPETYNGEPLCYAALAAQKNHYAIYLMSVYGDPKQEAMLRDGFAKAGKKLDMGKSCVRFRRLDDLALDVVAKTIAATPPKKYIEIYEASRAGTKPKAAKKKS
jgi:uncharacterized protein YdhG (YjbR/CyaY superfamily)